ncbi:MAG: hypothetical protein KatS3mg015_2520 [Fimbriimonadales bacterium]|nr:MAG: hypothetical protein KatS3mg015_2520 [Fimbriimonadales bacterium]
MRTVTFRLDKDASRYEDQRLLVVTARSHNKYPSLSIDVRIEHPPQYDERIGAYRLEPTVHYGCFISVDELEKRSKSNPALFWLAYLLAARAIAEEEEEHVAWYLAEKLAPRSWARKYAPELLRRP